MNRLFLQNLRAATGPMHAKLEATHLSGRLLAPDISLAEYAAYLLHMRAVVGWSEEHVFPLQHPVVADAEDRRKLPALNADIAFLNKQAPLPVIGVYAGTPQVLQSAATALGHMYVMEGATLGGKVILNHIKATRGFDEENGASFFNGYGKMTGMRWKGFLGVFTEYVIANNCEQEAIAGAVSTFESIQNYFAGN